MKTKKLMAAVAVALTLCVTIGGTLAWLTDKTDSKVNTFTVGEVTIDLTETLNTDKDGNGTADVWEGQLIPGNTLAKDPTVTVVEKSEACWLFVKVDKSANLDKFISYEIASGWTALTGTDGVYYREVEKADSGDQDFAVLKGDNGGTVTVKDDVTNEMMKASDFVAPTLTFTAYAVQKANVKTVEEAWEIANPTTTP